MDQQQKSNDNVIAFLPHLIEKRRKERESMGFDFWLKSLDLETTKPKPEKESSFWRRFFSDRDDD